MDSKTTKTKAPSSKNSKKTLKIILIVVAIIIVVIILATIGYFIYKSFSGGSDSSSSDSSSPPSPTNSSNCLKYTSISGKDLQYGYLDSGTASVNTNDDCYNTCFANPECQWFGFNGSTSLCYQHQADEIDSSVLVFRVNPTPDSSSSCPSWKRYEGYGMLNNYDNMPGVTQNNYPDEQSCQDYCVSSNCDFYTYDTDSGACQVKSFATSDSSVSVGFSNQ